ncbi:MAG: DUF5684 domain-containing protein [Sedimentisphaerales bacterium]
MSIIYLIIMVVVLASFWQVFVKAGRQGWEGIIPIYNCYVLLLIVNKPIWWLILMFIPIANIVVAFLLSMALAEKFGKSTGFAVGMFFLPFIFYPILAFGDAQYKA